MRRKVCIGALQIRNSTVMCCCSRWSGRCVMVDAMASGITSKTDSRLAARCAAIASLGAAVIHFAVTPMHWRDWVPSGMFFAALATFQLVWAFFVWARPAALVLAAGIAANAGAAVLWVMSCITGPPVGPSAGQPEAVGAAGICVLLLQCYVVMGAGWSWARKYQPEEVSGFGRSLVLMGANTVMAGAVTVGLVASLQGHHHHHHGAAVEAQGEHHAGHEAHMDGGAHMEGDMHMEGNHHPSEPQSPPAVGLTKPPTEVGLPVTDMALDTDGDHHHEETLAPSAGGAAKPPLAAVAPAAQPAPPAQPAPAQPQTATADSGHDEADGHQHHHDD